jgi:beta-xylosidase
MIIYTANENGKPDYGAVTGVEVTKEELANYPRYAKTTYDRDKVGTHTITLNAKKHEWVYEALPQRSVEDIAAHELKHKQSRVRSRRNVLIGKTDYLLRPDYPISAQKLEVVKAYCQALRDITLQPSFAETGEVEWPQKPF